MNKQTVFVGMKHGYLTVTKEVERNSRSIRRFECSCECGGKAVLRSNHFYPHRLYCSRSCPLLSESRQPKLAGRTFGDWLVLSAGQKSGRRTTWLCRCKCGIEKTVLTQALLSGESRKCRRCGNLSRSIYKTPDEKLAAARRRARECNRRNPARIKANKIRYESQLKRATPAWLTKEDWKAMNAFYEEAKRLTLETGLRHEVDHIIPLFGKSVSGLHVPSNLQVLTQADNVSKSNRYADLLGD